MGNAIITTGSIPFEDGSGFTYPIEITACDSGYTLWIGDVQLLVAVGDWATLAGDIDRAIRAFNIVKQWPVEANTAGAS